MPGYGYAKISREISSQWPSFIEPYLEQRPSLALCLVLVDVNVPPQESDRQLLDFLTSTGRPFLIVGTKSDRLSGNQLRNSLQSLAPGISSSSDCSVLRQKRRWARRVLEEIRAAVETIAPSRLTSTITDVPFLNRRLSAMI